MVISTRNGTFSIHSSQFNYLIHRFIFTEIDKEIIDETNFIISQSDYDKADKIIAKDKYKHKLR